MTWYIKQPAWFLLATLQLLCLCAARPDDTSVDTVAYKCTVHPSGGELHIDCSNRNLTTVPKFPPLSTSIDLSINQIKVISSSAFSGLGSLKELNISNNPIEYIANDAFLGTMNLSTLLIRRSLLLKQKDLILDLLLGELTLLKEFALTFSSGDGYPDNRTCLQYMSLYQNSSTLSTVDVLEIDSVVFEAFQQIKTISTRYAVKELKLFNNIFCIIILFKKEHFDIMPELEKVSLMQDHMLGVSYCEDTFSSLYNLRELSFYNELNVYCYASFEHLHYFFVNVSTSLANLPRLQTLRFSDICELGIYDLECHVDLFPLANSSSLETFISFDNAFTFSDTLICKLPKTLKHFQFVNNCLMYAGLDFLFVANPQIVTFVAPYQNNTSCLKGKETIPHTKQSNQTKIFSFGRNMVNLTTFVFTHSRHPIFFTSGIQYEKLKILDLSWNQHNVENHLVIPSSFSAQRPNLLYLDLTGCQLTYVERGGLSNLTRLNYLYISHNNLGSMSCEFFERLQNLHKLTELQLDSNRIDCIETEALANMKSLRKLHLQGNLISSFAIDMTHMAHLQFLDLSYNRLPQLPRIVRDALDRNADTTNVSLDLTGNILQCNCDTLEFLKWLTETNVHVENRNTYKCQFKNGTQSSLEAVHHILSVFSVKCASKTVMIISVSVVGTFFLAMLVTAVVYINRWKIRYLYYMTKLNLTTRHDEYETIFDYDAFISYTSDDSDIARTQAMERLEEEKGLRLCIHERDFPPGHSVPMNICRCIHNSKRTLFFISRAFLSSRWCNFELRFAVEESLATERKVIMMVMLESIPAHELPVQVIDLIRKYAYLEYPRNRAEAELDLFWERVHDFISGE